MWMTIVAKDFRQHRKVFLATLAVSMIVPWFIVFVDKSEGLKRSVGQRFVLDISIALVISYFSPSMIAFWLMAAERTKRTLLILRMLPLESDKVLLSKEIAGALGVMSIGALNLLSFWWAFRTMIGQPPGVLHFMPVANGAALLLLFLQISLWTFLCFDQKWATQIPFLSAIMIQPVWRLIASYISPHTRALFSILEYGTIPASVCAMVLFHVLMRRSFDRQDWSMPTAE